MILRGLKWGEESMESVRTKRGLRTPFLIAGRSVKHGLSETSNSGMK